MNQQNIKNSLLVIGALVVLVITAAIWNGVSAYSRSITSAATFSVTGQGKSVGIPDVAQFSFSVTNEGGKDIASLQKDNVTKTNAAIDAVKAQGVEVKDIETQGYDIQPRYQSYACQPIMYNTASGAKATDLAPPQPCPPSEIVGYTVTQTVSVKVRDFSKTGTILSAVTAKGANTVSGLSFMVDNPSQLQGEARAKAINDAKAQAENLARAGGFTLGRLIGINNQSGYQPPVAYKSYALDSAMGGTAAAPAPTIEPGSKEVNETVTLTYEIR